MISDTFTLWHLLPAVLYAETHFRFKFIPSFIFKREPEIIADAPHRLEPGRPLPVMVLIKDADKFPIRLRSVAVDIVNGIHRKKVELFSGTQAINDKLWWKVFDVPVEGLNGWKTFDVTMSIEVNGRIRDYHNDNHRTSSRKPLRVYISEDPLPSFPGLQWGEAHAHSQFTDDQVEFGSPIEPTIRLARALGLKYYCVTDHSYDLDDAVDDYAQIDPLLPKWKTFQAEVDRLNADGKEFAVIRGEEVTCRNGSGENIHLLLLGAKKFFWGTGDGGERGLDNATEHSIPEVLAALEPETVAFAAHAKEPVPFIQRLLLNRGVWSTDDLGQHGLRGIQFANGKMDHGFRTGYAEWISALLAGKKLFSLAGDDAHGNFNRFRQVQLPHITLHESPDQLFGKMRTGIFSDRVSEGTLLKTLATGSTIISDGPAANILTEREDSATSIGKQSSDASSIRVQAASSKEFGSLQSLILYLGVAGERAERVIGTVTTFPRSFLHEQTFSLPTERASYVRAEVRTSADACDERGHFCFTNPVWL